MPGIQSKQDMKAKHLTITLVAVATLTTALTTGCSKGSNNGTSQAGPSAQKIPIRPDWESYTFDGKIGELKRLPPMKVCQFHVGENDSVNNSFHYEPPPGWISLTFVTRTLGLREAVEKGISCSLFKGTSYSLSYRGENICDGWLLKSARDNATCLLFLLRGHSSVVNFLRDVADRHVTDLHVFVADNIMVRLIERVASTVDGDRDA